MSWDRALFALFDDLEQQAEGLALVARDAEVAEHGRAEYAAVDLESRVHGSVGAVVTCDVLGGRRLHGAVARAGRDWLLLEPDAAAGDARASWVVHLSCVTRISGLGPRAVPEGSRGVVARLGLGSVLRRLAESREPTVLALADGTQVRGRVGRIGADFVEVLGDQRAGAAEADLVALSAVAALRGL